MSETLNVLHTFVIKVIFTKNAKQQYSWRGGGQSQIYYASTYLYMFKQFMAVQRKCTKNIVLCSRFGRRVMRGIKTPECDFSDSSIWWRDVTSLFYLLNSRRWPFNLLSSALTILGGKLFIWKILPLFRLGTKRQGQSYLEKIASV